MGDSAGIRTMGSGQQRTRKSQWWRWGLMPGSQWTWWRWAFCLEQVQDGGSFTASFQRSSTIQHNWKIEKMPETGFMMCNKAPSSSALSYLSKYPTCRIPDLKISPISLQAPMNLVLNLASVGFLLSHALSPFFSLSSYRCCLCISLQILFLFTLVKFKITYVYATYSHRTIWV